ncbi:MAG: hypothetical protein R6X02_12420 [Enhygromyxa sp.]
MHPFDLLVAYALLISLLVWGPLLLLGAVMAVGSWRGQRAIAAADHEALELLAGRALPGAGNSGWSALANVE